MRSILIIIVACCVVILDANAQWNTSSTTSNYSLGNVLIGQTTGTYLLDINATTTLQGVRLGSSVFPGWVKFITPLTPSAYNPIVGGNDQGIFFGYGSTGDNASNTNFIIAPHSGTSSGIKIDRLGKVTMQSQSANKLLLAGNGLASGGSGYVIASLMIGRNNGTEIQAVQDDPADDDVQAMAFRVKSSTINANPSFEAARFDSKGNFGLGTNSPSARLHVNEVASVGTNLADAQILSRIQGTTGANKLKQSLWLFRDTGGGADWYTTRLHDGLSIDASFSTPGTDTKTWWERDPKDNIQSWGNGNATYMTLSNGSLGIGTVSPDGLQVNTALTQETSRGVTNLRMGVMGTSPRIIFDYNGYTPFEIDNNQGQFRIYTPGSTQMVINSDGKVGIGTMTLDPAYILNVNGKIKAEELAVVVDVPADYVFAPSYNLMPLSEVSKFVHINSHLPNVPSAEEIKREGWQVGEMNNKLLEKVEELTLYLIELENKVKELQSQVDSIKKCENK
jgi:hypothetical protein